MKKSEVDKIEKEALATLSELQANKTVGLVDRNRLSFDAAAQALLWVREERYLQLEKQRKDLPF